MMTLTKLLRTSAAALGALAVASVTQANAADIYSGGGGYKDVPVAPCCSFAGFYIGGNLGIEWSEIDVNRNTFRIPYEEEGFFSDPFGGKHLTGVGGFGGGQLGYNWQSAGCCWVYGVELDLGGIATKDDRSFLLTPGGLGGTPAVAGRIRVDGGFYGDITGRAGYTWGSSLFYAKGGFAWLNADVDIAATIVPFGPSFHGSNNNNTLTGWTVGAGWEYLLNPNWSMKIEYLHFDFGNIDNRCCNDGSGLNNFKLFNNDLTADTIKLGFNYFFHPAVVPLK